MREPEVARIVAQIAPQRSTQYSALASALAPFELRLSPLGSQITNIRSLRLGGQEYLAFELTEEPDEKQARELAMLATTSAFFVYYESVGQLAGSSASPGRMSAEGRHSACTDGAWHAGPLLRPIETHVEPDLPPELVMTRRYRGKTNELLTYFLCNIARWSSGLAHQPWKMLRVFDPLAGGGTTLFAALVLGADVAGVEHSKKAVESTATFIKQYMREQGIPCREKQERLRKVGRRWTFTLGDESPQRCILAHGDTVQSQTLISGFKPQLIIADLPYGVQHRGTLRTLLTDALPIWASMLPPTGAMALAWESTRFSRTEMISLVESVSPLTALSEPPYNMLVHRVDRVIKQRDILVARLEER